MICVMFWCGKRMCSVKSVVQCIVCGVVGLVHSCSCLSMFVIISFFGLVVKYVEFPCCLRSVGSGAQIYCPSSLFRRYCNATTN
jgi:hypothetical protein